MKCSRIIIGTCLVLGFSLSSFAGEMNYNCLGLSKGGDELLADISIQGNPNQDIVASKVVLNISDRTIAKEFVGPLKTSKEIPSVSLDNDFESLHFDGRLESFKLTDLSDKVSLTIDVRGGDRFSLICGLRN
ncbi:hypothetical protein [Peredibacter starrii]|uniref:Secreted protein n=1 Tax=Peredibacter starrii TaxID=28202 RepID=A0AAX4HUD1_9BACT|nr:hypothetical protein [Peredibacter starrii]WPU66586.1 hypothetical protein SOO65_07495 [Peredibacter starrii]